jgi:hypothetical protein
MINICARLFRLQNSTNFFGEWCTAFGEWRTDLANFLVKTLVYHVCFLRRNVGEIEWQIIRQMFMGVHRLFYRGGQKFSRWGARTYFLPKKTTEKILFFSKKSKNILFWPALADQRGARAPLPSPADAHANVMPLACPGDQTTGKREQRLLLTKLS